MKKLLCIILLVLIILLPSCETVDNSDSNSFLESDELYFSIPEYSFEEAWHTRPYAVSVDLKTPPPVSEIAQIPYDGSDYIELNGNMPFFKTNNLLPNAFMFLSPLDALNRAGMAICCVGPETICDDERQGNNLLNPSGWHSVKYDIINSEYLFHRCHILSYQLTGENSKLENLITGTCYFNTHSMMKFEKAIADCIKSNGFHVMYRATPVYASDELVARGIVLEAYSVEDNGSEVCFCVYIYNVQPGIDIDYLTGESKLS